MSDRHVPVRSVSTGHGDSHTGHESLPAALPLITRLPAHSPPPEKPSTPLICPQLIIDGMWDRGTLAAK